MNELKKSLLQSMQTASYEIKYHKQFIESSVRTYREKTKGDVWAEMLDWYDFIKDLEYACAEIRRQLWMYHDLHDFIKKIDLSIQREQEKKNKESDEDDGEIRDERCIDCYQSVDVLEHGRGKTPCERGEKMPIRNRRNKRCRRNKSRWSLSLIAATAIGKVTRHATVKILRRV